MDRRRRHRLFFFALAAALLVLLISYSLGIFLFDQQLIVFKKVELDKVSVYTNVSGLAPCWRYSLFFFLGIGLATVGAGLRWSRKRGRPAAEGLVRQAWTFSPFLLLAFNRFVEGKYVKVVIDVPLGPLLWVAAFTAVVGLNASLHRDFRLRDALRRLFFPQGRPWGEKTKTVLLVSVLALLWVQVLTSSVYYQRYSSLMVFLGDEPKYLRMAYSLASDGDLDLTNNFVGDDVEVQWLLQRALTLGRKAVGDYSIVGRDGGIYHFHMPGLSFLLLPGFVLDLTAFPRDIPNTQALMFLPAKMIFTRAWILLLALAFFLLTARLVYRLFRSRLLLAVLLLAMMFLTPIPDFAFQVYPELAAALCLVLGLNALFFPFRRSGPNALAFIIGIGFLPWLHQRFIPLAVSLYALFLFQSLVPRRQMKRILVVSLGLAAIGLGYACYFYAITGSPWPWSMYSQWGTSYTRAAIFPSGFFGYIFDTRSGLLALFPVFLFALSGIYWGVRLDRVRAGELLALTLPYFCLISITPWHGIAWETTRMSTVLFPLFLLFAGYALQALRGPSSWAQVAFYAAGLAFLFLNKALHFWTISLGNVLVLPHQVGYIIQCAAILVGFYLVLWALDRRTKKTLRPQALFRWGQALGKSLRRAGRRVLSPALGKTVIGLGLAFQSAYALVYLNNWQDKALSQSYFTGLSKVERLRPAFLHPQRQPSAARFRTDTTFVDIFEWDIPFQLLPGHRRQTVRFGPGFLLDKCPAGCYKVDIELYDLPPEFSLLSLDFMRETREMKVVRLPGKGFVSTIYLAFEDKRISPEFVMRYEDVLTRPVKGRLMLFPIPSLVFGQRLMIRLAEGLYPSCIRPSGTHLYLSFMANAFKDNSTYRFSLSLLEDPSRPRGAAEVALGRYAVKFRTRVRHKVDIRLDQPGWDWPQAGTLVFSVRDSLDRPLGCRSLWLPFRSDAWLIPLPPPPTLGRLR